MSDRQYPRQAWVLSPSFRPKQVTLVKKAYGYSTTFSGFDEADSGKTYNVAELYNTPGEAIAAGREKVKALQADIAKRQETVNKRIVALDKAEKATQSTTAANSKAGTANTLEGGEHE